MTKNDFILHLNYCLHFFSNLTSNVNSSDGRTPENGYKQTISEHPLQSQTQNDQMTLAESKIKLPINTNRQNHSRTSSETSDLCETTGEANYPEPQPRKRPIIGKRNILNAYMYN